MQRDSANDGRILEAERHLHRSNRMPTNQKCTALEGELEMSEINNDWADDWNAKYPSSKWKALKEDEFILYEKKQSWSYIFNFSETSYPRNDGCGKHTWGLKKSYNGIDKKKKKSFFERIKALF